MARTNISSLLSTLWTRQRVVVTEHSVPSLHKTGTLWRIFRSVLYPRAHAFIVPSKELKEAFHPKLQQRATIIPNPALFEDGQVRMHDEQAFRLIAVGRLSPVKGFDLLLQAMRIVVDKVPSARLTVWGDGEERGALEQLRNELNLTTEVTFAGFTEAIFEKYAAAELFVLSSRHEAFPGALLEAMAAGLPVISFDCPTGPRSIIRDQIDGVLVPAGEVMLMAEAIVDLLSDRDRQMSLGARAREVRDTYGMQRIVPLWERMLAS